MARLTAAQARDLAGPTVEEHVDWALSLIEAAAKQKKREVALVSNFG
jgi:hypothetical protein